MDNKRTIAIYGGSFSPPHMGHVMAAREYLADTGADRIVVIPAKRPPHKSLDGMVSDADRIRMCELAFCEDEILHSRCEVSDWEISRNAVSYTVDTIEHFRSEGYTDVFLLVGTDMLLSFESWHRYKDIFGYATLCYIDRYDRDIEGTAACAERFRREYGARIISLDAPVFDVSSSQIRRMLGNDESIDGLVPGKVKDYIIKNALYK